MNVTADTAKPGPARLLQLDDLGVQAVGVGGHPDEGCVDEAALGALRPAGELWQTDITTWRASNSGDEKGQRRS